jgi:replicative DNA helicase
MRACARRLNAELGAKGNRLGLLIIDSFETIPPGSAKRRLSAATLGEVETAEIVRMQKEGALKRPPWWKTGEKVMRDLKRLAKALGIPVIITAKAEIESCSADVTEVFTDKAVVKIESDPTMTGFIDSFILEHADIVVLIYNEAYYHPENKEDGNAGIVVAKNPRGKTGAVEMKFEREYTKFSSRD